MSKKISVARLTSDARHTVTVPLTLEDEAGNVEKIDARVIYRGMSLKDGAALDETLAGMPSAREQLTTALATMVIAMPDFVDDAGEPVKSTVEFFDSLDGKVLNIINTAITEDRDPNTKPSNS